jgi:hypothetical protein
MFPHEVCACRSLGEAEHRFDSFLEGQSLPALSSSFALSVALAHAAKRELDAESASFLLVSFLDFTVVHHDTSLKL